MSHQERFKTFADFYPFYLHEHSNRTSRRLHVVGIAIALGLLIAAAVTREWGFVAAALVAGYGFAFSGHFFFEHNRPASFRQPWFSFMGDWRMSWDIVTGKIPF